MSRLKTSLTKLLDIEHPILLAPMGSNSGGAMASAVTEAGGLRIIGGGYGDRTSLEAEIEKAGNSRVGIGFITWAIADKPGIVGARWSAAQRRCFSHSATPHLTVRR